MGNCLPCCRPRPPPKAPEPLFNPDGTRIRTDGTQLAARPAACYEQKWDPAVPSGIPVQPQAVGLPHAATPQAVPCGLPLAGGACPALSDGVGLVRRRGKVYARLEGHGHAEWRSMLKDLVRAEVTSHRGDLERKQRGNGAYTLRPLSTMSQVQVDHVFECQAMGDVLFRAEGMRGVLRAVDWQSKRRLSSQPVVVQSGLSHACLVHNSPDFLVVTSGLSNRKKQGAFQRALRMLERGEELERGIEAELAHNFSNPGLESPFEPAHARLMAREVTRRLRDLEEPLIARLADVPRGLAQGSGQGRRYEELADEVRVLYDQFAITQRI
mmetsp:Transcript_39526/g.129275  ORF Transcript_39526/g.129275 Transcript_39526/m.129275 type:complete len:326 (+) Transcript_39526:66-1043(+)